MIRIRKLAKIAFCLVIIGILLFVPRVSSSYADEDSPPIGVDHLRGRWDGVVEGLNSTDQPLILFLNDFAPDPNDSAAMLAGGCLAVGEAKVLTPIAARAINLGDGNFNLTVLGTAVTDGNAFTIQLVGLVETLDPGVEDDSASGEWATAEDEGSWSATHHDRRRTECPPVDQQPGLHFRGDVYTHQNFDSETLVNRIALLEGYTNIVSSAMLVQRPDGTQVTVPFYTDIFSPGIDFISEFRFVLEEDGNPISGGTYLFTLLDALGNPILGTTETDVWTACLQDPPRNVKAVVTQDLDIDLSWDPVQTVPGFDPANQIGFYQIGVNSWPSGGPTLYGTNEIQSVNHLIPWNDFEGSAPGSPDGFDFGIGLNKLDNGNYEIGVQSFSLSAPDGPNSGLECATRDFAETLLFNKDDNVITFFTP